METNTYNEIPSVNENENMNKISSSENFQKFIHEVFEKNGVLGDLRAYLRSNIVNVLKSVQTGKASVCQQKITQRLDLTYQALNVLIADYLLRLDFSYSLSIFVSEIPLSNMVLEFAKSLLQISDDSDATKLRIGNNDVWSILKYLGLKCETKDALRIVHMYKKKSNMPLLLCIIKCMMTYQNSSESEPLSTSADSISSLTKSSDVIDVKKARRRRKRGQDKCYHFASCKTCQGKVEKLREKYKGKKKSFVQAEKHTFKRTSGENMFLKNINVMDQCVIDEMYHQLKSVYETEVEMMRREEEGRVKRSLASHALQLQKRREEMEESFKARERELERNIQKKKQFVWGLARALRDQHANISRAMRAIRTQTDKLSDKEDNIKKQIAVAEELLNSRGEEMRKQISEELITLTDHIDAMKLERDSINKERQALENIKITNQDSAFYESLKNELQSLKDFIEITKLEPKTVIEVSTLTDCYGVTSRMNLMNNEQDLEKSDDKVKTPNRVVNILKKKNVNFHQMNSEDVSARSKPTFSSDSECKRDSLMKLREENSRLASFADQQRAYIDELTSQRARLHAELAQARFATSHPVVWRPRTAPPAVPAHYTLPATSSVTLGGCHGGGEALRARPALPSDPIPFIGSMQDYEANKRHINQWRSLHPPGGARGERAALRDRHKNNSIGAHLADVMIPQDTRTTPHTVVMLACKTPKSPKNTFDSAKARVMSPKTVLREAKQKLRNKNNIRQAITREKSPNAVLREARLRLRKLEIEAEAVEKSYLDFRRRQSALRGERSLMETVVDTDFTREFDMGRSRSEQLQHNFSNNATCSTQKETHDANTDLQKYLREYKQFDISSHFRNKTTAKESVKPIPTCYKEVDIPNDCQNNYLDTPLIQFRKLYQTKEAHSYIERITENTNKENEVINSDNKNKEVCGIKESPPKSDKERGIETITEDLNKTSHNGHKNYDSIIEEVLSPKRKSPSPERNEVQRRLNEIYNEHTDMNIVEIHSPRKKSPPPQPIYDDKEINDNILKSHIDTRDSDLQDCDNLVEKANDNFLRVEIETIGNVSSLQLNDSKDDVLLVVQNSPNTGEKDFVEREDSILEMIVSPTKKTGSPSLSLKKSVRDDIVDGIMREASVVTQYNLVEESLNEEENAVDYPDDFSADVDNYDSHSGEDLESPVSLPKSSEDENFWDS